MAEDAFRVLAGDCSVTFAGGDGPPEEDRRTDRGRVLVVAKPDGTVLVHDCEGYRPVAWLTRADAVAWQMAGGAPSLSAVEGDRRLEVTCHEVFGNAGFPASAAGTPAGRCPSCGEGLVRTPTAVSCTGCGVEHGIPRDAEVLEDTCEACGLPRMAVERGERFEVCVDRRCESLDDAVRARFDRAWSCPDCGRDLRIIRRGGLLAGCDGYPDCEVAFAVPSGVVNDDCDDCGLPVFEAATGDRCLDASCGGG